MMTAVAIGEGHQATIADDDDPRPGGGRSTARNLISLCQVKGFGERGAAGQMSVEVVEESRRGPVFQPPERADDSAGAGLKEGSGEVEDSLAAKDLAAGAVAGGEDDDAVSQPQVYDLIELKEPVVDHLIRNFVGGQIRCQDHTGELRPFLIGDSVCRNVHYFKLL